jgi:hypothetical protein
MNVIIHISSPNIATHKHPTPPSPPPSFFSSETLDQRPENPNQNISPKTGPFSKKHLKKRRVLFSSLVPLLGVFPLFIHQFQSQFGLVKN